MNQKDVMQFLGTALVSLVLGLRNWKLWQIALVIAGLLLMVGAYKW